MTPRPAVAALRAARQKIAEWQALAVTVREDSARQQEGHYFSDAARLDVKARQLEACALDLEAALSGAALEAPPELPLYVYHGPHEGMKLLTFPELPTDRVVVLTPGDKLELRWVRGEAGPLPPEGQNSPDFRLWMAEHELALVCEELKTPPAAQRQDELWRAHGALGYLQEYVASHGVRGVVPAPPPESPNIHDLTEAQRALDIIAGQREAGDHNWRAAVTPAHVEHLARLVLRGRAIPAPQDEKGEILASAAIEAQRQRL